MWLRRNTRPTSGCGCVWHISLSWSATHICFLVEKPFSSSLLYTPFIRSPTPPPLMPLSQSSACCNYRSVPPFLDKSFIFCRVELFQTYGIVLLHSVACLFTPLMGAHSTPKPGVEFRTSNMPDKPFIPVPHIPSVCAGKVLCYG